MSKLSDREEEFMENKYFASFSVNSPTTKLPHVTTVWGHYEDGKFFIITNKLTAKYRFISQGSDLVGMNIHDPSGFPYISVNGKATLYFENDRDDFWEIITRIIRKYNSEEQRVKEWLQKMRNAGNRMLVEIEPANIFSTVGRR